MKFIIGNDIHIGSKHETHDVLGVFTTVNNLLRKNDATVVFNGDIFDMANVPKKDVVFWKYRLKEFVEGCKRAGFTFIRGNHCLNQVEAPDFAIIDGVYFSHGDIQMWGKEKSEAYRSKKPGAGFLKRSITPLYDNLRHLKKWKQNPHFIKAMDEIIKTHNPRAAVFGHVHPVENMIFDYKGVKCYILKRGIQTIEI
jgi:hypothetical protein